MKNKITEKDRQASLPLMEAVAVHTGVVSKIRKDFTPAEAARIIKRIDGANVKNAEKNTQDVVKTIERREKIIKIKKSNVLSYYSKLPPMNGTAGPAPGADF